MFICRFLATLDGQMVNSPDLPESPSRGLQIKLNGGLLYQMFNHPGQMNTPHQFQKTQLPYCANFTKIGYNKPGLSGYQVGPQPPELAPVEDNEREDGNDFPSTVG